MIFLCFLFITLSIRFHHFFSFFSYNFVWLFKTFHIRDVDYYGINKPSIAWWTIYNYSTDSISSLYRFCCFFQFPKCFDGVSLYFFFLNGTDSIICVAKLIYLHGCLQSIKCQQLLSSHGELILKLLLETDKCKEPHWSPKINLWL